MKKIFLISVTLIAMILLQGFQIAAANSYSVTLIAPKFDDANKIEFKKEIPPSATETIAAKGDYSVVRCERSAINLIQSYDEPVGIEYCYFVCLNNQILTVVNQTNKEMIAKSFAYTH
jgi:hypothetical protein